MKLKDFPEGGEFLLSQTSKTVYVLNEHIESIGKSVYTKKGTASSYLQSWEIEVFNVPIKKYYAAHVMIALTRFCPDLAQWMNQMKAAGYNLFWAYADNYIEHYPVSIKQFLDAAQVAGIPVLLGSQVGTPTAETVEMIKNSWDHPAILRINGKRVFADYDHDPGLYAHVITGLQAEGINKSDFLLWSSSRYPQSQFWLNPPTWSERVKTFANESVAQVDHLYDTFTLLDGLINFAVDKGDSGTMQEPYQYGALDNVIVENKFITDSSKRKGKLSMAGINAFYASVQFTDFGFKGAATIWQNIIDLPVNERPDAVCDTTANDYVELSYVSVNLMPTVKGLSHIPLVDQGFFLGNNTRETLTDHSGLQKFLRPWVDAFLKGEPTIKITTEKIFSWYWIHSNDVPLIDTIPTELTALNSAANGNKFTQEWWDGTVYKNGSPQVSSIKANISGIDKIRMAAHLTKPGYLKINNTVSALMPAGPSYFEIQMDSFRGKPVFRILNEDQTIRKTLTGLQSITDSCWPGGYNYLSV